MGFYGTLKLIFFKVSIDDWSDQLTRAVALRLAPDDEAEWLCGACARSRPLRMSDQMIDLGSAACAWRANRNRSRIVEANLTPKEHICFDLYG